MKKKMDGANLKLALKENNKRLKDYVDTNNSELKKQLDRSNFVFVDEYNPLDNININGLSLYIDFLNSFRSKDLNRVYNVVNNNIFFDNTNVVINNKKAVFNGGFLKCDTCEMNYPFTIDVLLKASGLQSSVSIIEISNPKIILGITDGKLCSGKTFIKLTNDNYNENDVNLITVCYESDTEISYYINGQKIEEIKSMAAWSFGASSGIYIGSRSYNGNYQLNGEMYRLRIYNKILSDEEILNNYNTDMEFVNSTVEYARNFSFDLLSYTKNQAGIEDTPVGHIISHMGTVAPKHYLVCDGTEYSISDYPYLAQHIQDNFGTVNFFGGDGSNTFCVPNLLGYGSGVSDCTPVMKNYTEPSPYVVTTDSEYSSSHQAWKVFSEITESSTDRWLASSGDTDAYVQIYLGRRTNIRYVEIIEKYSTDNSLKGYPVNLYIQGSNDGISFKNLYVATGLSWDNNETKRFQLQFSTEAYSYYRFTVTKTNGNAVTITRIKMYEVIEMPYIKYEPTYFMNIHNTNYMQPSIYSEEEKIIGSWIDGRPLYQKTLVNCGNLPNNTSKTIQTGLTINDLINVIGVAKLDGTYIPLPYVHPTNPVLMDIRDSNICIATKTDFSSYSISYIMLQYTKITDEPNSYNNIILKESFTELTHTKEELESAILDIVNMINESNESTEPEGGIE